MTVNESSVTCGLCILFTAAASLFSMFLSFFFIN